MVPRNWKGTFYRDSFPYAMVVRRNVKFTHCNKDFTGYVYGKLMCIAKQIIAITPELK